MDSKLTRMRTIIWIIAVFLFTQRDGGRVASSDVAATSPCGFACQSKSLESLYLP